MHPDIKAKQKELKKLIEELNALADQHGEPVSYLYKLPGKPGDYYDLAYGYVPKSFAARVEKTDDGKELDKLYDMLPPGTGDMEEGFVWLPSMC